MSFTIKGWPEGHPALTRLDDYPFGYVEPQCPDPTSEESKRKRDGYSASFNALYESYKRRAAEHEREFNLSQRDFWYLTSQPCIVCAAPPSQGKSNNHKNPYIYNGLDRRDSSKGYVLGNVVSCCGEHNRIKSDHAYEQQFKHCLAVVLSELSKTAVDCNDIQTLERLIDLFPNVRFLQEHHKVVWQRLKDDPRVLVATPEMALPLARRGEKRYSERPPRPTIQSTPVQMPQFPRQDIRVRPVVSAGRVKPTIEDSPARHTKQRSNVRRNGRVMKEDDFKKTALRTEAGNLVTYDLRPFKDQQQDAAAWYLGNLIFKSSISSLDTSKSVLLLVNNAFKATKQLMGFVRQLKAGGLTIEVRKAG